MGRTGGCWRAVGLLAAGTAACGEATVPPIVDPEPDTIPTVPTIDVVGSWSRVGSIPEPLLEAGAAVLDGEIWLVGGIDADLVTVSAVYRFDPVARSWTSGPEIPGPRNHIAVTRMGDSIFAIGGAQSPSGGPPSYRPRADVHMIHAGASDWIAREPLPEPRAAGGAAAIGSELFVVGGFHRPIVDGPDWFEWESRLAPSTLRWRPGEGWDVVEDIPTLRDHVAVVALDGGVHAIGGRRLLIFETTGRHERLDPSTGAWEGGLAARPRGRGGAAAVVLDGRIHLLGGEPRDRGTRHDVFDPAENRWLVGTPLPRPVHGAPAVVFDGRIYLFGGAENEAWDDLQRDVWMFTPS